MLPGPDRFLSCPHCGALAKQFTLASGNTFGAELWSDGLFDAPMLPQTPPLAVCGGCHGYFWPRDAECVGEDESWGHSAPEEWRAAEPLRKPTLEEYYVYLDRIEAGAEELTADRERQARLLAWHADNDRRRTRQVYPAPPPAVPPAPRFYRNLERLLVLLEDDDPNDRLTKAEIRREMRQFGEALALLTIEFPEDMQRSVECIRELARGGIAVVRPVM